MCFSSIKIGSLNIRSLLPSLHELRNLILHNSFDIFCICESWLHNGIDDNLINIDGYKLYRKDRGYRGGGVCIYASNSLNTSLIYTNNNTEQLWISLKKKRENIVIGVSYRPPSQDIEYFLSEFEDVLSIISPDATNIICTGDFNINLYNLNNLHVENLYSVLDEFNLSQIVDSPTRITSTTATLIDLIIILNAENVLEKGVIDSEVSDHQLVYCKVKVYGKHNESKIVTYRNFKNFNYNNFEQDLFNIPFFQIFDFNDIDSKVNFLVYNLIQLFNRHAPIITSKCTKQYAPWLTDVLKTMMKLRDRALNKYKRTNNNEHWIFYKQLRNYTTQAVRREKKAYFNFNINNVNAKQCWKILKSNNIIPTCKDNIIPDHLNDANKINHFFVNSLPSTSASNSVLDKYKNDALFEPNFKFQQVDEFTVLKIIKEIKTNATGCDGLNIKMITLCCPHIIPYLTHIVNICLLDSVFPTAWKSAVITVLPKKPDPGELKDLRAISILPTLSKLVEKIMENQIREYISEVSLLPLVQSGFRSGHSCTTALLHIVDDIMRATDQGLCTILVLLDFSRAFDTLNFEILLSILKYIGLTDGAIKLIQNYIEDRHQKVVIQNKESNYITLKSGVPQGSILGPLLFTIYTSQLTKCLNYCVHHLYADDTQLYISFKPADVDRACYQINQDLNTFVTIARNHCLIINPSKSNILTFGPKSVRSNLNQNINITIDQNEIYIVEEAKNLGVVIDSDLRFKTHISKLMQKSYATIKLIYGNRHYLTRQTKIMLCESLVLSLLNFADSLYGPNLTSLLKHKIQKIQNSCLRLIYGIRRHERISHKLIDTGWLNMERRRILHSACLYHTIIVRKIPHYLYNKIQFRTDVHTINIRFKGLLTPPNHYHEYFKRSFTYQICNVYNNLPIYLKEMSLSQFKSNYKKVLFNQQCQQN